jgi:hypothetical protein
LLLYSTQMTLYWQPLLGMTMVSKEWSKTTPHSIAQISSLAWVG